MSAMHFHPSRTSANGAGGFMAAANSPSSSDAMLHDIGISRRTLSTCQQTILEGITIMPTKTHYGPRRTGKALGNLLAGVEPCPTASRAGRRRRSWSDYPRFPSF